MGEEGKGEEMGQEGGEETWESIREETGREKGSGGRWWEGTVLLTLTCLRDLL